MKMYQQEYEQLKRQYTIGYTNKITYLSTTLNCMIKEKSLPIEFRNEISY